MKPDVIDVFDRDVIVYEPPLPGPELKDEDIFCIFSCATKKENSNICNITKDILENFGDIRYRFSPNEIVETKYIIIEFTCDIFDEAAIPILKLCCDIGNHVRSQSFALTVKHIDGKIETIHFYYNGIERYQKAIEKLSRFLEDKSDSSDLFNNYQAISLKNDLLNASSIIRHENFLLISKDIKVEEDKETLKCIDNSLEYVYNILNKGKSIIDNNKFPTPCYPTFHMLFFPELLIHIPIILSEEKLSYKSYFEGIDPRYIPSGNVLGCYSRGNGEGQEYKSGPHIVLYPEVILSAASDSGISFEILFAKTLIHEIAHAILDNYEVADGQIVDQNANWPNKLEAKAMEESLANMITLAWFKEYASPEEYKQVKHFIDCWQSSIYRFGLWQEKIDADWKKWLNSDKQTSDKLVGWFNRCFSSGNIKIPIEDYNKDLYDKVFG